MKQCPKCNRSYDDSQSFCLMDGTPLTVESEQETLVKQQFSPAKKNRLVLWAALTGLVILIFGATLGGFLIYKFAKVSDTPQSNRQTSAGSSPPPPTRTAAPKETPKTSPSPAVSPDAPTAEPTPTAEDSEESEEITPISWDTNAVAFKNDAGLKYKFQCPAGGSEGTVWGSDVYTQDSSICTAAVHAGLFSLEEGGTVTIEFRNGRATYGGTTRNGITSRTYGEYPSSFIVRPN